MADLLRQRFSEKQADVFQIVQPFVRNPVIHGFVHTVVAVLSRQYVGNGIQKSQRNNDGQNREPQAAFRKKVRLE